VAAAATLVAMAADATLSAVQEPSPSPFPRGLRHFALQVGIFALLGALYAVSGIYGRRHAGGGVANAEHVMRLERALRLDWEHPVQRATLDGPALLRAVADQTYFLCQFVISTAFLIWLYVRRHAGYAVVRDALVAANAVALATLFVLPVAPPRLVPGGGYVDTLDRHAVSLHSGVVDALNNPYAAMPSLHVSYALALGAAGVVLCRNALARAVWAAYPVLVSYSIVATGNHFVLDAVGGVLALAPTPLVRRAFARIAQTRNGSRSPGTTEVATATASASGTSSTR
jgi:membrane-associated phospholipid phosphatase